MEKISWAVRVENVLRRVMEERKYQRQLNKGRLSGLVTSRVGTAF
jgi:hypothetical protein